MGRLVALLEVKKKEEAGLEGTMAKKEIKKEVQPLLKELVLTHT